MSGGGLPHLLTVSAVVMGLAQTIAKERLFAPLRERLGGRETWLGYLVSCPYCASHWILVRRRQRTEDEEAATRRVVRRHLEQGRPASPPPH